jgi:hypothetical protein
VGSLNSHVFTVLMMDCGTVARIGLPLYSRGEDNVRHTLAIFGIGEGRPTKGWVCEVAEEGSNWFGSSTGPHTKEVWTGRYARLSSKALIFYGYK